MRKRILSIVLALVLLVSSLPFPVLAAEQSGLINLAQNAVAMDCENKCPSGLEAPRYAFDGDKTSSKWCMYGKGWMCFTLEKYSIPQQMRVYHAGNSPSESRPNNTASFDLQVLDQSKMTDEAFLASSNSRDLMANDTLWKTVSSVRNNTAAVTTSSVSMTEAHRVFRFNVIDAGSDNTTRIYEIELFGSDPTVEPINRARNAAVLGAQYGSPKKKESPSHILDGDLYYTKWCMLNKGWMCFALEQPSQIRHMRVYHAGCGLSETAKNNTSAFDLEVLNESQITEEAFLALEDKSSAMDNSTNWTKVASVSGNLADVTNTAVSMTEARRVFRFNVTDAGSDDTTRIYELELYESAPAVSLQVDHGSASVDGTTVHSARPGSSVTVSALPDSALVFDHWVVHRGDVVLKDTSSPTTTFTMPDGDVYLEAIYQTQEIDSVFVSGLTMPVLGESPDFTVSVPEGAPYHLATRPELTRYNYNNDVENYNGVWWRYSNEDQNMSPEMTFDDPGERAYFAQIVLIPNVGYRFAKSIHATINGKASLAKMCETYYGSADIVTVDLTAAPEAPTKYAVTVEGGTAAINGHNVTSALAESTVNLTAGPAPQGKVFDHWEVVSGDVTLANAKAASTTFTMPAADVQVKAIYRNEPTTVYSITVDGGSASMNDHPVVAVAAGTTITLTADPAPQGKVFDHWEVVKGNITLADAREASTTFTMPASTVHVKAVYTKSISKDYSITVENGTASVNGRTVTAAPQGATVTLQAAPDSDGLLFDHWEVLSGDVDLDVVFAPSITFTMPSGDVRIKAVCLKEITDVSIFDLTLPVMGEHPDFDVTPAPGSNFHLATEQELMTAGLFNDNCYNGVEWKDDKHDAYLSPTSTYDNPAEYAYYLKLYLVPNDGYRFGPKRSASINGQPYSYLGGGIIHSNILLANFGTYTAEAPQGPKFAITVTGGKASVDGQYVLSAKPSTTVTLRAETFPDGLLFDHWEVSSGNTALANPRARSTTFIMPDGDVRISAVCVDQHTQIPAPANFLVTLREDGKPYLTWDAVDGAEGYEIQRADGSGEFKKFYRAKASSTSLRHGSAKAGETYSYRIRAIVDGETGAWTESGYIQAMLGAPEISVTINSKSQPVITWSKVDGAQEYEVVCRISDAGFRHLYGTKTGTRVTHGSSTPGETYRYIVIARANGVERISEQITVLALATPQVKLANRASDGKPVLTWDEVPGADHYDVYCKAGKNGGYKLLKGNLHGTSLRNGSAKAGTTYYYYVVAVSADGEESEPSSAHYITCDLARPDVRARLKDGKPYLTWNKVSGAIKYEVYRSVNGGSYKLLTTVKGTSLRNGSAKSGQTCKYRVKAICSNKYGNSALSYIDTVKVK